jgi:hypothetical protein
MLEFKYIYFLHTIIMSFENFGSNFESQEELPSLKKASNEDIKKV